MAPNIFTQTFSWIANILHIFEKHSAEYVNWLFLFVLIFSSKQEIENLENSFIRD